MLMSFNAYNQCTYPNGTCSTNVATCAGTPGSTIDVGSNETVVIAVDLSGQTIDLNNRDVVFNGAVTIDECTMFTGAGSASISHLGFVADGNNGGTEFTFTELNNAIANCGCTTLAEAFGFLPVELIAYTGKITNDIVLLNWSTAQESSNDYFLIEHSTDGRTFSEVDKVEGQGTSAITAHYEWSGRAQAGNNYYRLTQFDFDGSFEVLGLIHLYNDKPATFTISPNPVIAGTTVVISLSTAEQPELIQLVSLSGQQWFLERFEDGRVQLPDGLKTGFYYLKITTNGISFTESLILMD